MHSVLDPGSAAADFLTKAREAMRSYARLFDTRMSGDYGVSSCATVETAQESLGLYRATAFLSRRFLPVGP